MSGHLVRKLSKVNHPQQDTQEWRKNKPKTLILRSFVGWHRSSEKSTRMRPSSTTAISNHMLSKPSWHSLRPFLWFSTLVTYKSANTKLIGHVRRYTDCASVVYVSQGQHGNCLRSPRAS